VRGEVTHDVAAYEPEAAQIGDPEALGIDGPAATPLPSIARDDELRARHVERIEGDMQESALGGVELGVDQVPGGAVLIPHLAHPVILVAPGHEVRAEAAARASRDTARAQEGTEEHREVPAVADEAPLGRTRLGERPRVQREDAVDHCRDGTRLDLVETDIVRLEPVQMCEVGVHDQALHDATEIGQLVGQRAHPGGVRPEVGERSRRRELGAGGRRRTFGRWHGHGCVESREARRGSIPLGRGPT
jgi:hypothetical protein